MIPSNILLYGVTPIPLRSYYVSSVIESFAITKSEVISFIFYCNRFHARWQTVVNHLSKVINIYYSCTDNIFLNYFKGPIAQPDLLV